MLDRALTTVSTAARSAIAGRTPAPPAPGPATRSLDAAPRPASLHAAPPTLRVSGPVRSPDQDAEIPYTREGMQTLITRVRNLVGDGAGEAYCAQLMVSARNALLGAGPGGGVSFRGTLGAGKSLDDSLTGLGLWSGWGRPRNWPRAGGWEDIARTLEGEVGRTAFVLLDRPDRVGHAVLVVNTEDGLMYIDPSATDERQRLRDFDELTAGRIPPIESAAGGLRARVFEPDGRPVSGLPVPGLESESGVRVVLLPADGRYRGSGVEDEETTLLYFGNENLVLDDIRGMELAIHPSGAYHIELETKELWKTPDGRMYRTYAAARRAAGPDAELDPVLVGMVERVNGVLRSHPHEVGRFDADPVFDAFQKMESRRRMIPGQHGLPGTASERTRLTDYYRDLGLLFTDLGRQAWVGPRPAADHDGQHYHFTQGVVASRLREFLQHVHENVWREEPEYYTKAHLGDGLAFGDRLMSRFLARTVHGQMPAPGTDPRVTLEDVSPSLRKAAWALNGYAALLYEHAAAAVHMTIWPDLAKMNIAALSRQEFDEVLRHLPDDVRDYLDGDLAGIWREFERLFTNRLPDFRQRYNEQVNLSEDTPLNLHDLDLNDREGEDPILFRDYFEGGLLRNTPADAVSTQDVFGNITLLKKVDYNDGGLLLPHVVLEVRSHIKRAASVAEARRYQKGLADFAARLYDEELRNSPEQVDYDARSWLGATDDVTLPQRGLRWTGRPDAPPPTWASQLGAAAAQKGRAAVVMPVGHQRVQNVVRFQEDQRARLQQTLNDDPDLSRAGIFVFPGFHEGIHRMAREERMSVIYALPYTTPAPAPDDGLRNNAGWRLVTFDNQVFSLGSNLTPQVMAQAIDVVQRIAVHVAVVPAGGDAPAQDV